MTFASYDGYPCVFVCRPIWKAWILIGGRWKPISVTEVIIDAGVLSEARFRHVFGDMTPRCRALPDPAL
jgi:hypothetical protein